MKTFALVVFTMGLAFGCDRTPATGPVDSQRDAPANVADPVTGETPATKPATDTKTPAPQPESLEVRAEALVKAMEVLAKIHMEHSKDCDGLATSLKGFAAEHQGQLDGQTPELHAWIDGHDAARTRLREAMGAVMTGGIACRDDVGIKAFYASLRSGR